MKLISLLITSVLLGFNLGMAFMCWNLDKKHVTKIYLNSAGIILILIIIQYIMYSTF